MHKYKVGDKVLIRNDLVADKSYGRDMFIEPMEHAKGKIATIVSLESNGRYNIDLYSYFWTNEMFVGKVVGNKIEV